MRSMIVPERQIDDADHRFGLSPHFVSKAVTISSYCVPLRYSLLGGAKNIQELRAVRVVHRRKMCSAKRLSRPTECSRCRIPLETFVTWGGQD
jgi:hypothetical protein